jgi:hypothetical protein
MQEEKVGQDHEIHLILFLTKESIHHLPPPIRQ